MSEEQSMETSHESKLRTGLLSQTTLRRPTWEKIFLFPLNSLQIRQALIRLPPILQRHLDDLPGCFQSAHTGGLNCAR
jgi:hypothetical protein